MAETEISEIEKLVNAISSGEVRNEIRLKLLSNLVYEKKGDIKVPEQYVDEMISYCQRNSDELEGTYDEVEQGALLTYAARVAKHAGRTEQARQLYEKAISFNDEKELTLVAARIAVEAGMETKSKELYGKILLSYEQRRDFVGAVKIAEEAEMPEEAKRYRVLEERLKKLPPHFRY